MLSDVKFIKFQSKAINSFNIFSFFQKLLSYFLSYLQRFYLFYIVCHASWDVNVQQSFHFIGGLSLGLISRCIYAHFYFSIILQSL